MINKNVFILSVGRRVELVKLFDRARKRLGIEGKIIGGDMDLNAPAIQFVDKRVQLPKVLSEEYIDQIIAISKAENVDLIVPTIDTELLVIAKNKERIEKETGAKINISDFEFIDICRDKFKTQKFFEENKFLTPRLITEDIIKNKAYSFPLFIKPLNGSSSINAFKINSERELDFFKEYVPNPIIQKCVIGEEFTVDVFCDFDSNPVTIVPRKRLATRSGEISKGQIVKDHEIIEDVKKLLNIFKAKGHITIQCIKTSNGVKYIEINPRFGGGAPMSIVAGADSPENLYRLLLGEKLSYNENYQENLLSLRYDEAIFISEDGQVIKNV
ncbi:ATP-grasp domain-containing protein [Cetobacterium sp.]|uniref:ATP-grasp domain-containing protein n=1 Tax=Cetobacterium sp. TaxID=2071632 RepID=UPI003F2D0D04